MRVCRISRISRISRIIAAVLLAVCLSSCKAELDLTPQNTEMPEETVTSFTDPEIPEDGGIEIKRKSAGQVLDYFAEIAFGSEYGVSAGRVCRFEDEIVYSVTGDPTAEDIALIEDIKARLNGIEGFPGIREADFADDVNFEIMFIDRAGIMAEFEDADESCVGMSQFSWETETCRIISAKAAIDVNETEERESTVCEEILQAMGLAMDSYSHPDSVFYQGKCVYKRPSELDYGMIRLLYSPKLETGMSKYDAIAAASRILKW